MAQLCLKATRQNSYSIVLRKLQSSRDLRAEASEPAENGIVPAW